MSGERLAYAPRDTRRKAVLRWLCPEQSHAVQDALRSQRLDGTGQWFLDLVQSQWLQKPAISMPIFWAQGIRKSFRLIDMSLDFLLNFSTSRGRKNIPYVRLLYLGLLRDQSNSKQIPCC